MVDPNLFFVMAAASVTIYYLIDWRRLQHKTLSYHLRFWGCAALCFLLTYAFMRLDLLSFLDDPLPLALRFIPTGARIVSVFALIMLVPLLRWGFLQRKFPGYYLLFFGTGALYFYLLDFLIRREVIGPPTGWSIIFFVALLLIVSGMLSVLVQARSYQEETEKTIDKLAGKRKSAVLGRWNDRHS